MYSPLPTKTIRIATLTAGLLATVAAVGDPEHAAPIAAHGCPREVLAIYAASPYATATGIRHRCALLQKISAAGEPLPPALWPRILEELSNRFAVRIDFVGSVGLPRQAVDYLLRYIPETAELVRHYTERDYRAAQVDTPANPKRFFVTNNDSFAASFTYLASQRSSQQSEYILFETGRVEVLLWTVWGNAFVHYRLGADAQGTSRYDIEVDVFTNSSVLRAVLESGLFHTFANALFRDILEDIQNATQAFTVDPNASKRFPPEFVAGLKRRIQPAETTKPHRQGAPGGNLPP